MAENVKSLRRRLRSIKNTKQITRAMEMVSAAKLRRSQESLMAGRPYAAKLQEFLGRLAGSAEARASNPLFETRDVKRRLLVVVTADRGLAGGFNAQIIKRAETYLRESTVATDVAAVGRKGADYFRRPRKGISTDMVYSVTDLAGKLSSDRSNEIADKLQELFLSGGYDEVVLLYNKFISMISYRVTVEQLLPLDPDALLQGYESGAGDDSRNVDYIMEPDQDAVFGSLIPRFVRSKVYIMLAEMLTSEHSARMVAMSAATKNCQELIDSLTLAMNKARQAAITKEILEIVGGAEALKG